MPYSSRSEFLFSWSLNQTNTMEFWGKKVKPGQTRKVKQEEGTVIHVSQATLVKSQEGESGLLYATAGGKKKRVIGSLSHGNIPHMGFANLAFGQDFELSHSFERGTVHFVGHIFHHRGNYGDPSSSSSQEIYALPSPSSNKRRRAYTSPVSSKEKTEISEDDTTDEEITATARDFETFKKKYYGDKNVVSRNEKETPKKKEEAIYECCWDCPEASGNDSQTIFVRGFENLRPKQEIKNALTNFFGSCGGITRVFVPIECKTRLPLGFAFINMGDGVGTDKALNLNGSYMEGRELQVSMAMYRIEYNGFFNFVGCDRCRGYRDKRYVFRGSIEDSLGGMDC